MRLNCQNRWWQRLAPLLWTAIGVLVWKFSSKAVQDILIFGAFAWSVFHFRRAVNVWNTPAGVMFAALFVHALVVLPFSVKPLVSLRDFSGMLEVVAGMFAISVIFYDRQKLEQALLYSAVAIALTLGYDLIRLWLRLGRRLMAEAHFYQPFILNHSNVASMMAGAAFFVFFYFFWRDRRRLWRAAGCIAGMVLCLAYKIVIASRGPQAAFAAAVFCAGFIVLPSRGAKLVWLCLAAAAGVLVAVNISHISPRFLETETMRNFSERTIVWKRTFELAAERPWLGYGYGKRLFEAVYYADNPPQARFHFPHAHQYWLKLMFEHGAVGVALYAAAWLTLAFSLWKCIAGMGTFEERLLPALPAVLLLYVHIYGLADFPDNIVQVMQLWLVPVALTVIRICVAAPAAGGEPPLGPGCRIF